ncbi:MAG: aldo/keto reductase [Actinobacteria bacterium]|nr:aldo/keto reductase [Actinomycetota bacterium]
MTATPNVMDLRGTIVLGTATMGLRAAERSRADDVATIRLAYDLGIRAFDTARVYAPVGDPLYAEMLLSEALYGLDDVLVMTKGGHFRTAEGGFAVDNSPARLRRDVEDSLGALRSDRIGLYLLHRADDESVPLAESVGELAALRDEGKIAEVGLSNVRLDQLLGAVEVAPVAAVQNQYSPLRTEWAPVSRVECDKVVAECEARAIPYLAYSPLATDGPPIAQLRPDLMTDRHSPAASLLAEVLAVSPALGVISGASRPETVRDALTVLDNATGTRTVRS